ncbi:hypothetical protein DL769_009730 [Monosporascus sp. CRB-8-3]|nr:hypothetical protein DL769_009730 [Monosporascus sp. CRB-8-3]
MEANGVTVETATRTTLSTILVTATSKTTDIPDESINDSRKGSNQQPHKHEVIDGSVATTLQDGLMTAKPPTISAYASVCPLSQAITSRVVVGASQAVSLRNTTSTIFTNATALFPNSTSQSTFASSASRSSESLSRISPGPASFTNTRRFSSPTKAGASSNVGPETLPNAVSFTRIGDAASTGSANSSRLFSATSTLLFNSTSTGRYSNGTTATVSVSSSVAITTLQASNGKSSVPYMGTTGAPTASITQRPFPNITHSLTANATAPPFSNITSSGCSTNTTSAPTPTATSDNPCGGQVSGPFAVQVAQPDGMFDGWFLQLSAAAIIFAPTKESATRFGIASEGEAGSGGRLCTEGQGRVGSQPLVAVAENGTDVTGGAVYFIDAQTLAAVGRLGYAALRCAVAGEQLACEEGAKKFWVACGLGLDITSDGDGVAEIGGWNCTAVALSPVYS